MYLIIENIAEPQRTIFYVTLTIPRERERERERDREYF